MFISEDGDGEEQPELLTAKDGIVKPSAVLFNEKQSHLIVCLDNSNVIKVYQLELIT